MTELADGFAARLLGRQPPGILGDTRECKLCRHPAHSFARVDFNKSCNAAPFPRTGVAIEYFRCQRCELLFTDFFDRWTPEDFARDIYNDAYATVDPEYDRDRPTRAAIDLAPSLVGAEDARILDYGSGSGVFEHEMRARGFRHVESFDPFSHPARPVGRFAIITCMDVIEHSPDPRALFADMLGFLAEGGCILVGQTLQPADIVSLRGDWWYVAPRNGHVTTYSCETMRLYAKDNGLRFTDFGNLFALTGPAPSPLSDAIVARRNPQPRRIRLSAPPADGLPLEAWQEAETTPTGAFRWTRQPEIGFGTHATPQGQFRVALRHYGSRDEGFVARSRVRVGAAEAALSVYEDELFAVLDLPVPARREITLLTPPPYSEAAAGRGADLRAVGLAIACGPA